MEAELEADTKYEAEAQEVTLIVYDNVSEPTTACVGALVFCAGPVLILFGGILFIIGLAVGGKRPQNEDMSGR